MIRILFNYSCNLYCSYCFEKHFWSKKDILTSQELDEILKFAKQGQEVYIVGGEPTQHPKFLELLNILKIYNKNKYILLTNGIFHQSYLEPILETFQGILLNLNDPNTYTDENWNTVESNLKQLATKDSPNFTQIGTNIYHKEQRFEYLIPIMNNFHIIKTLRVAFTNPNYCQTNKFLNLQQLKEVAPVFLNFITLASQHGYGVQNDCPIPPCLFSTNELQFISQYVSGLYFGGCSGGFTFYPGLKIGHCFGSFPDLYDLNQFQNVEQIETIIRNKEDPFLYDEPSFPECENCLFRRLKECQGSCLSFPINKYLKKIGKL